MRDEGRMQCITDPVLIAADMAERAERVFLSLPARHVIDELSADFLNAEARWEAAEVAFARAVPSTQEGALAKLEALEQMLEAMPVPDDGLELLHVRTLITYMRTTIERN